mmetsp:Transcript_18157/g.31490  ORF Transcript_18157/g.31490 Transcript_18157/m.31490 type:complete len:256 (-) Transcript_18157:55-822(-)
MAAIPAAAHPSAPALTFDPAPIGQQIFKFEKEHRLDTQYKEDNAAPGQSTDLCSFYFAPGGSTCEKGGLCQYRHARNDRLIVCKHWLRGLCKKGEYCEYLHEFDMSRMPECYFFSKFGECSNAECMYRHVDLDKKRNECPYYARGFCKHGAKCRFRHIRKVACPAYLAGFCKLGPNCEFGHAKFDIRAFREDENAAGDGDNYDTPSMAPTRPPVGPPQFFANQQGFNPGYPQHERRIPVCHKCGTPGHTVRYCRN